MTARTFLHNLADSIGLAIVAALLACLLALGIGVGPGIYTETGDPGTAPETPATEFHGLPGNNPAFSNEAQGAAPAAAGGDGGLHNIDGVHANGAADTGQPPACTAHGGLGAANKNCN